MKKLNNILTIATVFFAMTFVMTGLAAAADPRTVSGIVFHDVNGNGQLDPGEPGLAGWTVTMTKSGGSPITATTDGSGKYSISNLADGFYNIKEVLKPGWIQTGNPTVGVVIDGNLVHNVNYGNFKLGEISGVKFEDINGNSKKDPEDKGLQGWTITLTGKDEITGQQVTKTAVTDSNGNYRFTDLTKGLYTLKETLKDGWIQTYPGVSETGDRTWEIYISISGSIASGLDFGNFRLAEVSGMKFNDLNGNGKAHFTEPNEPGLPGWTITITGKDEITGQQVTKTAVTDANGNYKITGLTKGTYTLKETLQPGWIQTLPGVSEDGSKTYTIDVFSSGNRFFYFDFGNFKLGEISGMKFEDINGNRQKDPEDKGLQGWTITLTGLDEITGKQVTKTAVTDGNGNYKFTGLTKGKYTLKETLQPGWIQTYPGVSEDGSITHTSTISTSGQVPSGLDFGNFGLGTVVGMKWEDLNANGKIDSFESGLSGWTITIKGTDTITNKPVNMQAITDAKGRYEFKGLTAGTYTITETLKDGWVQTTPQSKSYTITVKSNSIFLGFDFGNFHKGEIIGGGYIPIPVNGKGAFDIWGRYLNDMPKGTMSYTDDLKKMTVQSKEIKTVATTLNKRKGVITGIATINGQGAYPFEVYVEDNTGLLEPAGDVFKISLPTYPYSKGDALGNGDIKILK